ncbi:hypothetical protein RUND412_008095 [Rhizina undulata]
MPLPATADASSSSVVQRTFTPNPKLYLDVLAAGISREECLYLLPWFLNEDQFIRLAMTRLANNHELAKSFEPIFVMDVIPDQPKTYFVSDYLKWLIDFYVSELLDSSEKEVAEFIERLLVDHRRDVSLPSITIRIGKMISQWQKETDDVGVPPAILETFFRKCIYIRTVFRLSYAIHLLKLWRNAAEHIGDNSGDEPAKNSQLATEASPNAPPNNIDSAQKATEGDPSAPSISTEDPPKKAKKRNRGKKPKGANAKVSPPQPVEPEENTECGTQTEPSGASKNGHQQPHMTLTATPESQKATTAISKNDSFVNLEAIMEVIAGASNMGTLDMADNRRI